MPKLSPAEALLVLKETSVKEKKIENFNTKFYVNPFKPEKPVTGKLQDRNYTDLSSVPVDEDLLELVKRPFAPAYRKYMIPMTTSQDIGWFTEPLIKIDRKNRLLHFPRRKGELGYYAELYSSLFGSTKNCRIHAMLEYKQP